MSQSPARTVAARVPGAAVDGEPDPAVRRAGPARTA